MDDIAYDRDGFTIQRRELIGADLRRRAVEHMRLVMDGRYSTGVAPPSGWSPNRDDPTALVKIDNAHMCDETLRELIASPSLGELAAGLYGADMVQVWATQLLYKPPGGTALGNVGWHQDHNYWHTWWTGEVFTVWVALDEVTQSMGPMLFIRGSHRWGLREGGNFFNTDHASVRDAVLPEGETWEEVAATLPAGGCSVHQPLLVHGSAANVSDRPRLGFAIHMRTEKAAPLEPLPYLQWLDDPYVSPVVFKR